MWRSALRALALPSLVALSVVSLGCERPDDPVAAEPVPECTAYEQVFNRCMHRDLRIAGSEALIPKTRADLARIREICTQNLGRMESACR